MLVDVVLMRRAGLKLPRVEIVASTPVRGRLRMHTRPWRETWLPNTPMLPTTFAYLHDPLDPRPLAVLLLRELRDARVNNLVDGSFVIVGLERSGEPMREVDQPQAWWCRLVEPHDRQVPEIPATVQNREVKSTEHAHAGIRR